MFEIIGISHLGRGYFKKINNSLGTARPKIKNIAHRK